MTPAELLGRFQQLCCVTLPRPGMGGTAHRHRAIFNAGVEDLSLAKLIEAHWDAVAILQEAGQQPHAGAAYAVWASEVPGRPLELKGRALHGAKEFCSGAALVDYALVTAGSSLVEVALGPNRDRIRTDESGWQTEAFRMTRTAALLFDDCPVTREIGTDDWYTQREGFWSGACGPAAAWAGGAAGLVQHALRTRRDDPHTRAHLAAMDAAVWAMQALLEQAGQQLDEPENVDAMPVAMRLRHTTEQLCTEVLRRFARALGPAPLVRYADVARRYAELDLFLRQWHGERDLEALADALRR